MKTDDICEQYFDKQVGLEIQLLQDEDEDDATMVLIQGNPDALKLLAELLTAVAEGPENDGFSISPFGAGSTHFSPESKLGIYIHRK